MVLMDNSTFETLSNLLYSTVIAIHKRSIDTSGSSLSYERINKIMDGLLETYSDVFPDISDLDRKRLLKSVTDNYTSTIGEKAIVVANVDAPRWYEAKKHEFAWDHWAAYKKMLQSQGRGEDLIDGNEEVINTILDYSGDPRVGGTWAKKGLVMGNVQSGKTQNYLGLMNKAIDAGYKTVIVLGGHQIDLRMQTQERVDEGVLGVPSRHLVETSNAHMGPIGVGLWHKNSITAATTTMGDFNKDFAGKFGVKLNGSSPVVFVIQKNTRVMARLIDWIKKTHYLNELGQALDHPLLLIDDEADYASINTQSHKEQVTLTNSLIRELLSQFSKSTYVGYTATPFANIFIDPDKNSYNDHDDLFPSDFMIKMPVPNAYLGQEFFFGKDALESEVNATSPIIEISDYEPIHNLKSKDEIPDQLPESLKDAIRAFIIVTAVRTIRGEQNSHNTMLVNISHLSKHQNRLETLIFDYKTKIFEALTIFGLLERSQVRSNEVLMSLERTYNNKFKIPEKYEEILSVLTGTQNRDISVWALNQCNKKRDSHSLNYSSYKDFGLNVIAIGGHKLSRGLTLEGLSISYFARNSKAYDTLMQMCRWFGYRSSYKDLVKVYLPEESISWYSFITNAINELYSELELMANRGERPKEFGLKVREHPGAMLIAAKNKIGAGRSETVSQDLWGQTQRRFKFYDDIARNASNVEYAKLFLEELVSESTTVCTTDEDSGSLLISGVSYRKLAEFIKAIDLPEDDLGNKALLHQLHQMKKANIPLPKVLLYNQRSSGSTSWFNALAKDDQQFVTNPYEVAGQQLTLPRRQMTLSGNIYRVSSVHLGNSDDEKLFLTGDQRKLLDARSARKLVDHDFIGSKHRDFVGLKIYFFAVAKKRPDGVETPPRLIHGHEATLGYTISFPRSEKLRVKTPEELRSLIKNTKYSYLVNAIISRNKDLLAYEDCDDE